MKTSRRLAECWKSGSKRNDVTGRICVRMDGSSKGPGDDPIGNLLEKIDVAGEILTTLLQ
jgi:hypothetical protein